MTVAVPRLVFDLRPHPEEGRVTTLSLAIYVDDVVVWPVHGEDDARLEIQIDDLLAHFTDFWKPLLLRQVYPIDVSPLRPSDLRRDAERRWGGLPVEIAQAEDETVSDFEEAHDLSHAFAGMFGLPSFWILRSGDRFILDTTNRVLRLPFADVCSALTVTGDKICAILAKADGRRWERSIVAWKNRAADDAAGLLAWSAGLKRGLANSLIEEGVLEAPRDFDDAANDNDELRIAARMAGALPPEQVRDIIGLARRFGSHHSNRLRTLSDACLDHIGKLPSRTRPFQQGEAAARFLHELLSISADSPVDVFDIVDLIGIELRHSFSEPPTLDGLAIWGSRHGPGIFLNEASERILRGHEKDLTGSPGARVTLAHELCHLLLDGGHALSAIEVLKARMPTGVEQRAKSFAGEFLLPTRIVGRYWTAAGQPRHRSELNTLVEELAETYSVTWSVAAWKIQHAARDHDVDIDIVLDAIAPFR